MARTILKDLKWRRLLPSTPLIYTTLIFVKVLFDNIPSFYFLSNFCTSAPPIQYDLHLVLSIIEAYLLVGSVSLFYIQQRFLH